MTRTSDFSAIQFFRESLASILARKQLLGKAGIMAGARVLSLIFGAVGSVWAARCLGPQNLGISGMVQSAFIQAGLFFGLIHTTLLVREYKNAKTRAQKNRLIQSANTFRLLLALPFCLAALVVMAFGLAPDEYRLAGWFFIPLLVFNSLHPHWVFQAEEKQEFQSLIGVLQPVLTALLYLLFLRPGSPAGHDLAVLSFVAAVLAGTYWFSLYRLTPAKGFLIGLSQLKSLIPFFRRSKWLFLGNLSFYAYTMLEQPLLGWLHSLEELGKYRTAILVAGAAQSFFYIVPTILYPRFIEWRRRGEEILWRRQWKLVGLFFVFGVLGATIAFVFTTPIYPIVFGSEFLAAAIPCAILLTSRLVNILNSIFAWGLMTDHLNDKIMSIAMMVMALLSFGLNLTLIPKYGMYAAAALNFASESFLFFVLVLISWRRLQVNRARRHPK